MGGDLIDNVVNLLCAYRPIHKTDESRLQGLIFMKAFWCYFELRGYVAHELFAGQLLFQTRFEIYNGCIICYNATSCSQVTRTLPECGVTAANRTRVDR